MKRDVNKLKYLHCLTVNTTWSYVNLSPDGISLWQTDGRTSPPAASIHYASMLCRHMYEHLTMQLIHKWQHNTSKVTEIIKRWY